MSDFDEDLQSELVVDRSLPPVTHIEPKLFIGIVTLILLGVYVVVLMLTSMRTMSFSIFNPVQVEDTQVSLEVKPDLKKIDLAQEQPERFTSDFAPATNIPLIESYEIPYAHGVQSTVVYATVLPVQIVVADFKARLEASQYVIVKMYESNIVSAIYAMKEEAELNITIASTVGEANLAPTTQVTISHFDK